MNKIAQSDASFFRFADNCYDRCVSGIRQIIASPKVAFRVGFLAAAVSVGYLIALTIIDNIGTEMAIHSARKDFQDKHRDLYRAIFPVAKGAQEPSRFTVEQLAVGVEVFRCIGSPRIVEGRKALATARTEESCTAEILRNVAINEGNDRARAVRALLHAEGFAIPKQFLSAQ